jgi:hypothetical protein
MPIGARDIGAPIYWRTEAPLRHYVGAPMSPAPLLNVIILRGVHWYFKKEADRTFRCASPIFMLIAYWLGFTNRKRKFVEDKTMVRLKSKQTSIATVRNHLRTLDSFPILLLFHWSLPLKENSYFLFSVSFFLARCTYIQRQYLSSAFQRIHCKKSWRSNSTPASGDAGPKHTGVEQSFRHPWRPI